MTQAPHHRNIYDILIRSRNGATRPAAGSGPRSTARNAYGEFRGGRVMDGMGIKEAFKYRQTPPNLFSLDKPHLLYSTLFINLTFSRDPPTLSQPAVTYQLLENTSHYRASNTITDIFFFCIVSVCQ